MDRRPLRTVLVRAGGLVALLLVVVGGIRPEPLFAQAGPHSPDAGLRLLTPGDELRITSPIYNGRAVHLGGHGDTLTVRTRPRQRTLALPLDSLARLERYRRIPRLHRGLEGAKWGALGGAAFGTLGMVVAERGPGDPPKVLWPLVGAVYFAVPTTLVFAAVPAHEWEEIPLSPRVQARLTAAPRGLALRLTW